MALTKREIIEKVTERLGCSNIKSIELVETLVETIKGPLEKGDSLLISGFGKFTVKQKAERTGRNPASGKAMTLAKRKVVTFQHSASLKDKLNK